MSTVLCVSKFPWDHLCTFLCLEDVVKCKYVCKGWAAPSHRMLMLFADRMTVSMMNNSLAIARKWIELRVFWPHCFSVLQLHCNRKTLYVWDHDLQDRVPTFRPTPKVLKRRISTMVDACYQQDTMSCKRQRRHREWNVVVRELYADVLCQ